MTDVDNFHLINDYWGYEMGTNILNFILKKLELFPQTLFVNRYHSDIFVGIIDITGQDPGKDFRLSQAGDPRSAGIVPAELHDAEHWRLLSE